VPRDSPPCLRYISSEWRRKVAQRPITTIAIRVATYSTTPRASPTAIETPAATSGDQAIGPTSRATTPIVARVGVIVVQTLRPRATNDHATISAIRPRIITNAAMARAGTEPWLRTLP